MKKHKVVIYYGKARYDLSDLCWFCRLFINEGEYYVRSVNQNLAHYLCAKEGGWRNKPKKKILPRTLVEKSVEIAPRKIKIVKKGT